MLKWQKEHGITEKAYLSASEDKRRNKYMVGVLAENNYPEYTEEYKKVIALAAAGKRAEN